MENKATRLTSGVWLAGMGLFLILYLLAFPPMCRAEGDHKPYGLTLGLFVKHADTSSETNEDIGLIAFSYNKYIGARFTNSYDDGCLFAGRKFDSQKLPVFGREDLFLRAHLYAGIIHGYDDIPNLSGFVPALLPTWSLGKSFGQNHEVGLEFMYIPTPAGGVFATFLNVYTDFGFK